MSKYVTEPTAAHVAMSSMERLARTANQKRSWTLLLTKDDEELGLKQNATLQRIEPYHVKPYTGKCYFEIDQWVDQPMILGAMIPSKRTVRRTLLIRQITANDIIKAHGVNNRLHLGLKANPPKVSDLLDEMNTRYKLNIKPKDVIDTEIPKEASCIIVKFSPSSLNYSGAMLVDLFTPIYDEQ